MTTQEAIAEKTPYEVAQERYQARIKERERKAAQTCSDILLGCDFSKITKTQIREIHQYIRRHLEWAELNREGFLKNGNGNLNRASEHLRQVELASRALNEWTKYRARQQNAHVLMALQA